MMISWAPHNRSLFTRCANVLVPRSAEPSEDDLTQALGALDSAIASMLAEARGATPAHLPPRQVEVQPRIAAAPIKQEVNHVYDVQRLLVASMCVGIIQDFRSASEPANALVQRLEQVRVAAAMCNIARGLARVQCPRMLTPLDVLVSEDILAPDAGPASPPLWTPTQMQTQSQSQSRPSGRILPLTFSKYYGVSTRTLWERLRQIKCSGLFYNKGYQPRDDYELEMAADEEMRHDEYIEELRRRGEYSDELYDGLICPATGPYYSVDEPAPPLDDELYGPPDPDSDDYGGTYDDDDYDDDDE